MRRSTVLLLALAASALLLSANPPNALADGLSWDLIAGQTIDVGTVTADRVGGDLVIHYVTDPGWVITEVHVYAALAPPTKSAPGQFPYGGPLASPTSDTTVTIPLSAIGATAGSTVYVAAHAVVADVAAVSETLLYSGDGRAVVTAFDNVPLDPDVPAVECWCHPHWAEHILPGFEGTPAECIWRSYLVSDPFLDFDTSHSAETGEIVDFLDEFTLPTGVRVLDATLTIACDNGYEVYLNGDLVGSEGLMDGWRTSPLTEPYVVQWDWLHGPVVYDVTDFLQGGLNSMAIATANEELSGATGSDNPAGLIYALSIHALQSFQTGWADGSSGIPFGKSWARYVPYVVPGA